MYTFKTTEQTQEKGSDYETYSLLYLLGMHSQSDDIQYVLVDCFNDTTGLDENATRLWDIQAKGHKTLNPKKIGRILFTLFDNYVSDFPFVDFILIVQNIDKKYLIDSTISLFGIINFEENVRRKIELGLHDEYIRRYKIADELLYEKHKEKYFLENVKFKIWTLSKSDTVKTMVVFRDASIKNEDFYESIFNEIRDKQSSLKNYNVEGLVISQPSEALQLNKHIGKTEITTLLINRIIGAELFTQINVPPALIKYLPSNNVEDIKDLIIECNSAISKTFFNKNNRKNIWKLLEEIVSMVTKNDNKSVQEYQNMIPQKLKEQVHSLDDLQLKFLIAKVLEGVK